MDNDSNERLDNLNSILEEEDKDEDLESLKKDLAQWKRDPFTQQFMKYLESIKQDNFNAINIATVSGAILSMDKNDVLKFYAINNVISEIQNLSADEMIKYLSDDDVSVTD